MQDVDARKMLEVFHRDMGIGADAGRRIGHLSRVGFGEGDQLRDGLAGSIVRNGQHRSEPNSKRDRLQVLERIKRKLVVDVRIDDERRAVGEQQRVAVGGRLCDRVGAERSARAGPVLDDDRLSPLLGKPLRMARATVSVPPPGV